jgi:hypothetical protein
MTEKLTSREVDDFKDLIKTAKEVGIPVIHITPEILNKIVQTASWGIKFDEFMMAMASVTEQMIKRPNSTPDTQLTESLLDYVSKTRKYKEQIDLMKKSINEILEKGSNFKQVKKEILAELEKHG